MGVYEDHMNAVAARWGEKYRQSDLAPHKFVDYMKKRMIEYGWSEAEAREIIKRAIGEEMNE